MEERLRDAARRTIGFMPEREGLKLYEAGLEGGLVGPLLEIGGYCGKSSLYLGAAARSRGTVVFSLDHHRGSEEHQPGHDYHDPRLVDEATGRMDTLPVFRRTIERVGLEDVVIAIVGSSAAVAAYWATALGLVFVDGGHSEETATADYEGWAPKIAVGGLLVIHDVFEDPARGGHAPHHIWRRALSSGDFEECDREGTLRVLRRLGDGH